MVGYSLTCLKVIRAKQSRHVKWIHTSNTQDGGSSKDEKREVTGSTERSGGALR